MRIQRLDEITINQIAAGEVVENSASVVKELVENSLDAGATQIRIDLLAGGRQLLRVSDNGCGMSQEEVIACLERHATSKLRGVEDLNDLLSFGFRGEAIPSIASISRLRLFSAPEGEDGFGVRVEAGQILDRSPVARERGTTVEVRDLFFNVPARLKFQKSTSADLTACVRVIKQLALAHPGVWLELRSGSEILFEALPSDETIEGLQSRCRAVLGPEWAHAQGVTLDEGHLKLRLLLQPPHAHRPNRNDQYIMLNRRVVQCPAIGVAVREALAHRLDQGRYPAFLAALELPPSWVDVNVHPQKREVRLRQEALLRGTVARATHCLLGQWLEEPLMQQQVTATVAEGSGQDDSIWSAWSQRSHERTEHEEVCHPNPLWGWQAAVAVEERPCPHASPHNHTEVETRDWGASVDAPSAQSTCTLSLFPQPMEIAKIGEMHLLLPTEEGPWAAQGKGLWLVNEGALKRAYLQEVFQVKLEMQSQPLLLPQNLSIPADACDRLECARAGYAWLALKEGIALKAIPACLEVSEACAVLEDWVTAEGLGALFWKTVARRQLRSLSFPMMLASQVAVQARMDPNGAPIRAWMSEIDLATYLSSHGLINSS